MENKKSKNARIENKKASFFMIGLVCASSLALMSFEYSNFNLVTNGLAAKKTIDVAEDLWTVTPPKIETQPQEEIKAISKEFVKVVPDPTPILPSEPTPTPVIPGPLPPVPGPPMPVTTPLIDIHVYEVVEEMPEFPGGEKELYKYLSKTIQYPEISLDNNSQGKAFVKFTIEKDGSISDVQIIKGVDKYIDKESIKVVENMPKWKPGKQRNQLVRVSYVLPINFTLK